MIPISAAVALTALAIAIAPARRASGGDVAFSDVAPILHARCAGCHAARPSQPGIDVAPKGVLLDTPAHIVANAAAIRQQAVLTRAMPLGNLTQMTDDERERLGAWIDAGARGP